MCIRFLLAASVAIGLVASSSSRPADAQIEAALPGTFVFSCSGCPQNPAGPSLYSVRADGSGFRRLTPPQPGPLAPYHPAWGPRGRSIVFSNHFSEIWTIRADGTRPRRLTRRTEPSDEYATWSPSGRLIVFSRLGSLYKMRANGTGVKRIVSRTRRGSFNSPDWSPDGSRIALAYSAGRIYVADAQGRRMRRVGPRDVEMRYPRWSPDGRQIAFIALRPSRPALMVMHSDGSHARVVAARQDLNFNVNPAWSPDGRRIAFVVERTFDEENDLAGNEIVTVRPDGSDQRRVVIRQLPPDTYSEIYGIDWSGRR
jgi:TolB protein